MKDLEGRTALITGGANGIGLGIAHAFAKAGVKLALCDLDESGLAAARAALSPLTEVETFVLDVRDREAFVRVADAAEGRLGSVTLLFNNAGVVSYVPLDELSYEHWDWVMGINLGGVINGVQTILPRILKRGDRGYIVNTASGAGLIPLGNVSYGTSKFAVVGLSESLRIGLKDRGVGVSALCPGPVLTDIVTRSANLSPDMGLSEEGASHQRRSSDYGKRMVAGGKSAMEVGEMVLAGVRNNQLYIHTDRFIEDAFKKRAEKVIEAMPDV